jgi:hypothetical protein
MNLEELKKEYENQDNRCTAFPIYVMVQEKICIGVMADGYSVNCPYGDGDNEIKYRHNDLEGEFDSIDELKKEHYEYTGDNCDPDDIEELNLGYIWHPVEFFLTIKGAEEYIKANQHNHGKLRTYVAYFERRNFEMRGLLKDLGFKVKN